MLLGRDAERQAVDQLIAGARIGRGGVLALTGEPGVGKTALLEEALQHVDGFRVLRATGTEAEREIPFAGLHALLRPALDQLNAIPGPQSAALSAALALTEGRPGDRFAIGAATLSLVCRYAEAAPVTVVVDDVQWLDRPSAEAITFAARRVGDDPVAVLLSARSGETDDVVAGLPRLELTGLDVRAAGELVRSTGALVRTDEQLTRLHEVTGGNPLALLELGRDPEALDDRAPGVPPPLSARLTAAFSRQLRQLDGATRDVLLVAVIANGDLRLTTAACAALRLDPSALAHAERRRLVANSGGHLTFRHPLLRAVAYSEADQRLRRTAHAVVAGLLPDADTDRRAWHLSESASGPDPNIADMLQSTAEHAVGRTAYAVASTAYERAARLSPDNGPSRARLHEAAAAAWAGGLRGRALTLLDEIESLPAPPDAGISTLRLRASIAARSGSLVEAREDLERAGAEAASPDDAVILVAEALQASLYLADTVAIQRLGAALSRAVHKATKPHTTAIGLTAAGMAKVLTGRGGADEIRTAVPLLATHSDPLTQGEGMPWLMLATLFLRDSEAGDELRRLVDDVRNKVGVGALPNLLFLVARDQATARAWSRAEANYEESIRLARETGQSTELAMSLAGLAWLESRQGKGDACRSHAAEAISLAAERAIHFGELWCLFALGDLKLAEGDAVAAVDGLLRLDQRLDELGFADPDMFPGPELVDALLRLGRGDEARAVAARFVASAEGKGRPWASARAQRALGLVIADDPFDGPFRSALELHARTLDVFETARTQLAYGARLRRAARRVDARTQLRAALVTFEELGATSWARVTATELEATGEKVQLREPTGAGGLTPQELQVSLLLAEGRTTRETAAALFLSPKTVEYHLRKVHTKLGIHSRAELAESLPR